MTALSAEPRGLPHVLPPRVDLHDPARPAQIRFVTSDDFPPFNFLDGNGRLTGFNVELARAICLRLAISCSIHSRPFPLLLQEVVTGKADAAIAGIADTPTLRRYLAFGLPYLRLPARFVVSATDQTGATPPDLSDKRVAVVTPSRYEAYLKDFFPAAIRIARPDAAAALDAVRTGEADAAFTAAAGAAFWLQGPAARGCCRFAPGAYAEPAYFGDGLRIAVARDNTALKDLLDQTLSDLDADDAMSDLALRFFPASLY